MITVFNQGGIIEGSKLLQISCPYEQVRMDGDV